MTENPNRDSPPNGENYLREIRDAVQGIQTLLQRNQANEADAPKIGMHQHRKVADVFLSKDVVLEQLRISQSTLAKWRYRKCIKYSNRGSRLVVYGYIDLMDALADNKLTARGFNPFAAYRRMLEWYRKNIENPGQQ